MTGGTGETLFAVSPHNTTSHRRSRSLPTYPINRMSESPVPIESVDIPADAAAVATAAASDDDDAVVLCCNLRTTCKHFATRDVLVIPCARTTCTKGMHLSCFTSKYKYADFPKLREDVQVVCTKGCYKSVASPMAITWRNNGPVGKEEEGCSERILLDWLMAEGNYAKFRGGPQTRGRTKKKVASVKPKATNANLDSSESEDNNDDGDDEDEEEDDAAGDVAIGVTVGRVVQLPRRSDISALVGSSGRKRRATSVSESFLDSNRTADQGLARLTKTRSEYYQEMPEKTARESAALDANLAVRKEAEAAQAAADVLTAGAEAMAAKRKLFDDCMEFAERYEGKATKEEILQLFPIYADVIDMVLRLQPSNGAGKVQNL
jgi:hypothetical protein